MILLFSRFDTKNILVENILLFVSHKYIELVECLKNCLDSGNVEHCTLTHI